MRIVDVNFYRLLCTAIFWLGTFSLCAEGTHEYLTTTKSGQLAELLDQCMSERIDSLTINGPLGGADLAVLAKAEGKLQDMVFLDMTHARPTGDGNCYRVVPGETINMYTYYYYYSDTLRTETHTLNQWHRVYTNDLSALFYGNESLQEVRLPSKLNVIGKQTFYKCSNLKKVIWPEDLSCVRYSAFTNCSSLRLSSEILQADTIEDYAFYACESLVDTLRLEGVRSIGDQAFWQCSSLECLVGDPYLQEIGASSFYGCEKLDSVYLCSDIDKLGNDAFFATPWFNSLPYEGGIRYIQGFACEMQWGFAAQNGGTVDLRPDTKGLGDELFYESGLKHINLPSSLKYIGERCFDGCRELPEIKLPEGIKNIGRWAFRDLSALKTISLPASLEEVGDEAFQGCTSLEHVDYHVPEASGKSIFQFCEQIASVHLGNTVRVLPDALFLRCGNLKEVVGGENVEVISENAFSECSLLKNFPFSQKLKVLGTMAFRASGLNQSMVLPATLDSIGNMVFGGCILSEVVVNHRIPYADPGAFYGCTARNGLVWNVPECDESCLAGNEFDKVVIGRDVIRLPQEFLLDAPVKIVEFESSARLKEIPHRAFENCRLLPEITLPSAVERIGSSAFAYCVSLQHIGFENKETVLKEVGDSAFYYNSKLQEFHFAEGLTVLGSHVLAECRQMQKLTLPSTLTVIGEKAFYNCLSLQEVQSMMTVPVEANILLFGNVPETCLLLVPTGSIMDYRLANGWNRLDIKELPTGIDDIQTDLGLLEQIKIVSGGIYVSSFMPDPLCVYSPDGSLLYQTQNAGYLALPAGIYILRCGNHTLRMVIP
ncbi:leucine-rich repeat domain-containing protein [Bacteroides eggerthii]|uniref:Leucine-rich repeat domain-containing protein n=1 Tax=Bacteroides eggerthii TaxID=28111 RepID=A0ABT7U216_9BACE|nr:leucine-rich repeat domain-containing protein [Bacteroides eggerthii]